MTEWPGWVRRNRALGVALRKAEAETRGEVDLTDDIAEADRIDELAFELAEKHAALGFCWDDERQVFEVTPDALLLILRAEEQAVIDRVGKSAVAQPGTLTVGFTAPTVGT